MSSKLPVLAAAIVAASLGAASAAPITYVANLDGPSEFPPVLSPGTGFAIVTLDTVANTLRVQTSFTGLVGTTTVAHIHCCVSPGAPTPTVGVATTTPTFPGFPTGVTSGTYDQTFDTTAAATYRAAFITANGGTPDGAEAALAAGLAAGEAYLNIHTSFAGGGEIRGFLTEVPAPATAALLLAGVAAIAAVRRRA